MDCAYCLHASLNEFITKSISEVENKIRWIFKDLGLLVEVCNRIKEISHSAIPIDSPCYSTQTVFPIKDQFNIVTSRSDVIGILKENGRFVDKSVFIKVILDYKAESRIIIARPRRWGKNLNLSMLYDFLKADVDDEGNIKERNSNYDLFLNGEYTYHGEKK